MKPAKKLVAGDRVRFGNEGKVCLLGHLDAEVEAKGAEGEVTLSFSFHGPALDQAIADLGSPPLPPYIASKRTPDDQDAADYQTMFAANEGAVAAPTAGLHFTPALEAALRDRGVGINRADAACRGRDVSAGQGGRHYRRHRMHAEWGTISAETAERAQRRARRMAAASSRSAPPRCGCWKARRRRTVPSSRSRPRPRSSSRRAIAFAPSIFCLTNFHLPRSTLFMLVSAFSGLETMQQRLCARDQAAATGSIRTAMRACCSARVNLTLICRSKGWASARRAHHPRRAREEGRSPLQLHHRHPEGGRSGLERRPPAGPCILRDALARSSRMTGLTSDRRKLLRHHALGQQLGDLHCVEGGALEQLIGGDEHRDRVARGVTEILADAADQRRRPDRRRRSASGSSSSRGHRRA